MTDALTIHTPEILHITDQQGQRYYGANQIWYRQRWQQQAGCGPTNSSHLVWYLSRTRPECGRLSARGGNRQEEFLALMEEMWEYVTPGRMGVNSADLFIQGMRRYGDAHGIGLHFEKLEVPSIPFLRPSAQQMAEFLTNAIEKDIPVAFLNLANGKLSNLDGWHWVTLIAFYPERMMAVMYDQGRKVEIDLDLWLRTTLLGGGFVAVEAACPQ